MTNNQDWFAALERAVANALVTEARHWRAEYRHMPEDMVAHDRRERAIAAVAHELCENIALRLV